MSAIAIANNCPGWYDDQHIPGISAMPVVDAAGPAFFGFPVLAMDNPRQAIGPFHGADDDAAAVAAVPAVGTAARHVFFPVEADHAAATVAAFDVDYHAINEHLRESEIRKTKSETNPKTEAPNPKHSKAKFRVLAIRIADLFRISNFGFGTLPSQRQH
jgi:hypothetical protein